MKKILLVDDDPDFNETLAEWLALKGYQVSTAKNGRQALALLKQDLPDLMITDIIMPEMDGIEMLMSFLLEQGQFPCKVIAISGGGRGKGEDYLEMISGLGVEALLTKPFSLQQLETELDKALGGAPEADS